MRLLRGKLSIILTGENEKKWAFSTIEIGWSSRHDSWMIKYQSWKEHPQIQTHWFSKWRLKLEEERWHFQSRLIFFFGLCCAACGILIPRPGIKPVPPAVKARSPNHWTTREFPELQIKCHAGTWNWIFRNSVPNVYRSILLQLLV